MGGGEYHFIDHFIFNLIPKRRKNAVAYETDYFDKQKTLENRRFSSVFCFAPDQPRTVVVLATHMAVTTTALMMPPT